MYGDEINMVIGGNVTESKHFPVEICVRKDKSEEAVESENGAERERSCGMGQKIENFKWDVKKQREFESRIGTRAYDIFINGIQFYMQQGDVSEAYDILRRAFAWMGGPMSIRHAPGREGRKNKWFDRECVNAKGRVSMVLRKFRRQGRVKDLNQFKECRKSYKEFCKRKKKKNRMIKTNVNS